MSTELARMNTPNQRSKQVGHAWIAYMRARMAGEHPQPPDSGEEPGDNLGGGEDKDEEH